MDPECPECQRIWREYADATTKHVRLENKLRLAAMRHQEEAIQILTPEAEGAGRLRRDVREAIRSHDEKAHRAEQD